jgi:threonylcarbamoyladenosine tRNA methylthiotransferase MtaB
MKYSVITFGCRVNQADSLGFEEELLRSGASASSPEEADLVVVNTCSVTASADQGARQTIRRIARANPDARIVVTGCYATREPEQIATLPNVFRIVANDEKPALIRLAVVERPADTTTATRFGDGEGSCGAAIEPGLAGRTAFTLRVQTGCAEACSYCIIPTTRGRPRSRPLHEVLHEVERVVAAGYKEIALTGVHLGSYGRDLAGPTSLFELLSALERWRAGRPLSFRISSLEPMDCSPAIVDLVASTGGFAPHFHLPLQHASNRMLAAMRRPYSAEYYARLVEEIRRRIPHASIGTDVIVGFPGETDDDFERLERALEGSPLTHVHVFPYSDRPGTEAASLPGKIPGAIVRARGQRIRRIAAELGLRFRQEQIGSIRRGLTIEDGSLVVTDNYLKLRIEAGLPRNEWVRVRVRSDHHGELLAG